MVVSALVNIKTNDLLESGNTLVLNEATMNDQLEPERLDQAAIIHKQTKELDEYLQEIMREILLATHEENQMAIAEDGSLDLIKANYFDVHKSTELVIFGTQLEIGKGPELMKSIDTHRVLLLSYAGNKLDKVINEMLDINAQYPEEGSWLKETFAQTPMIAALISLSNLQFKIQFLEGELLKELL